MENTEKELTMIRDAHKYMDEKTAKRLEDSAKRFEGLVSRGLAHSRGYNIMTADNTFFATIRFNVPSTSK